MDISSAKLRQFITNHFDSEEVIAFCFDYFPAVFDRFGQGMAKGQQIQLLLIHCRNQNKNNELLVALQRERRHAYEDQLAPQPDNTLVLDQTQETQRDPHKIFLSYAHQDERSASQLATDLRTNGWKVWTAVDNISPSQDWAEAINDALEKSGIFLLLLTQYAVQSYWVKKETNYALEQVHKGKMQLIPLQVQERVNIPPLWSSLQYLPFTRRRQYSNNLDKLLAELAKLQSASPLLHLVDWQTKTEQLHTSNGIPSDTALQEIRKPQSMKFLPQSQKTVLCIEDNPSNMNLLEQISKAEGYNLIKAEDGLIALDILKKPIPDIILLDMNLPSIDGYELASYFKADKQLAHIPLIAITGNVLVGDRERCLEAGCDDYLPKPLDIRKMREVLRLYLD